MFIHDLKIAPEYFETVKSRVKTFEIRKNDRNYQVNDILVLKEYENKNYTGRELAVKVTYMTNFNQEHGYIVLATQLITKTFVRYLLLTDKEKDVFKEIITYLHLHGYSNRDTSNMCWEIIRTILEVDELTDSEQQWYMDYWDED